MPRLKKLPATKKVAINASQVPDKVVLNKPAEGARLYHAVSDKARRQIWVGEAPDSARMWSETQSCEAKMQAFRSYLDLERCEK